MINNTTPPQKKLEKGVGYETIYCSDKEKVEISTSHSELRKTLLMNGREIQYKRESNPDTIREIETRSVNWKLRGADNSKGYYVEIQLNAENKPTGNIRIVPHRYAKIVGLLSPKLEADKEKYTYYVRRKK